MKIELNTRDHKLQLWPHNEWGDPNKPELKPEDVPKGLTFVMESSGKYSWPVFTFPELPANYAFYSGAIVAEIEGRRWKITLLTTWNDGIPAEASVVFEETTEELTPPAGERTRRGDVSRWFGQPSFIQNTVLPHHEGKSAILLACIESGWGDSGNENVFVAFNDEGLPVGIYLEYSCC